MKLKRILGSIAALSVCSALLASDCRGFQFVLETSAAADDIISYCYFEDGTGGWEARSADSAVISSDNYIQGSKSLFVSGRSDSWNGAQVALDADTFKAGSTYAFSAAAATCSNKQTLMMLSLQYTSGEETYYDHIASAYSKDKKWAVLANSEYTIPAGATDPVLYVETESGTSDFYVDDFKIGVKGSIKSTSPVSEVTGDLNGDEKISIIDLIMLKNCLLNPKTAPPKTADADSNGDVDLTDATLLIQYMLGQITAFPDPPVPTQPETTPFDYNPNVSFREAPGNYFNPCAQAGKIVKETYNGINGSNTLNVYLPNGYDSSKQYNIFYLMHGGGENENTIFSDDVKLGQMLDNMIMNGELEPMIVVTPTFNKCAAQTFYKEWRASVIPFVEGKYSTYADSTSEADLKASRMHRAYGGFSMGSASTWAGLVNGCLDICAYWMPLSGDNWEASGSGYNKAKSVADAIDRSGLAKNEYFIMCSTGSDDIAYPNMNPQMQEMQKMSQFVFTSDFSKGNFYFMVAPGKTHWWGYVKHYIYDTLPYFFHES
ncbi:MAG: carbohydrate binding domain-containing protein [Oscillospiraceae bacterium]|nr:carbohydrate binding domain-containing protein [Oscillospiraceae bacterium]